MVAKGETITAAGATTTKGHNHLMASRTPGATATKEVVTRAATPGRHLQPSGNQFGVEVLLVGAAMVGMILEAATKVSETIGTCVEAAAEEDTEVIPATVGATLGTTGVHPRLPDQEVHPRRQLPHRTVATRGEATGRQPAAAAVVVTATRRATTNHARPMEVVALHLPEGVAALMAEVPMAVPVATGDEHAKLAPEDGLPWL